MPAKAKVALAEIVQNSGLSGIKVLQWLKIPQCESVHIQDQASGTNIAITVYYESGRKIYNSAGEIININPAFPVISYIEAAGNHTMVFRYKDSADQHKIYFQDKISIPMPPGWPQPYFLKPKYPVLAS